MRLCAGPTCKATCKKLVAHPLCIFSASSSFFFFPTYPFLFSLLPPHHDKSSRFIDIAICRNRNMSLCSDGLSSDQYFLVNFIMSNYLGPDVYSDNPRCSASQRLLKGLPPYTLNHIGSSSLTIAQLQSLYYHVLRNAKSSLVLHPNMIYMYLKGYLPLEPVGMFPQFTSFFPTKLHPQKMYSPSHEIVKGIVIIDDPALAFIREDVLQRFRCLSRLNDLKIDRVVSISPPRRVKSPRIEQVCSRNGEVTSNVLDTLQDYNSSEDLEDTCKRKQEEAVVGHADCVVSKDAERVTEDILTEKASYEEAKSNEDDSYEDCNSSAELQNTCKRKKEEEAVVGPGDCVITDAAEGVLGDVLTTEAAEGVLGDVLTEKGCSKYEEANANGIVSDEDCISSPKVQDTCKRKKEEEAVVGPADCVITEAAEGVFEDIQTEKGCYKNEEANSSGVVSDEGCISSPKVQDTCKRKKDAEEEEAVIDHADLGINKTPERFRETYQRKRFKKSSTKATNKNDETDQPSCQALVPVPTDMKDSESEPPVVTTGTASKGTLGPSVGVVDIGVNKVAYFFQVALPGVRKDDGEFSCEIESDGTVILEGSTTTGGETIKRHSRVFKMKGQKLDPPGPFKLCFNLPGPVDPRLFSPNFRSDGIFEAVIIRHDENSN